MTKLDSLVNACMVAGYKPLIVNTNDGWLASTYKDGKKYEGFGTDAEIALRNLIDEVNNVCPECGYFDGQHGGSCVKCE